MNQDIVDRINMVYRINEAVTHALAQLRGAPIERLLGVIVAEAVRQGARRVCFVLREEGVETTFEIQGKARKGDTMPPALFRPLCDHVRQRCGLPEGIEPLRGRFSLTRDDAGSPVHVDVILDKDSMTWTLSTGESHR